MLKASAIADGVIAERGYFTARRRSELADLGFARYQQLAPALVVPVWGVDGEVVNYQCRPDRPRVDADRGRQVKYETVAGSAVRLDVPPPCRRTLGSPVSAVVGHRGRQEGRLRWRPPGCLLSPCSGSIASTARTGTGCHSTSAACMSSTTAT